MPAETVLVDVAGPVATVTLNRPEAYNALDPALAQGLFDAVARLGDDDRVRSVVLTGAGKAFCAGGDLRHIFGRGSPRATIGRLVPEFHKAVLAMRSMGKPIVGALNGVAAGGGFSLALACDLRVMAASATMKVAYLSAGLAIDGGGSFALPRIVGVAKALELALTDPVLSSEACRALGLVGEVVPDDRLAGRAREIASALAERAGPAVAATKRLLWRSTERAFETQMEEERELITACAATPEAAEAVSAFREKRAPRFHRDR